MDFPYVYAVKHKDDVIRSLSRSGGIFTAISDYYLDMGGVVYGCVLNEKFEALHIRAETKEERDKMRGSKYIQSDLKNTFLMIKDDLKNGRKVLFTGTACQVAGLRAFLGDNWDDKLFCIDIICHGVPSTYVWKKYLQWQEKKNKGKVISVDFRNKTDFGWAAHIESLKIRDSSGADTTVNSEVFKTLFYGHRALRPCCYKCPYRDIKRLGDITIGDYWGIEKAAPGFNDNKGVSIVLVNNMLGNEVYDRIKDSLIYKECRIEDSLQPPLKEQVEIPSDRSRFWDDLENRKFSYIVKKYGRPSFGIRVRIIGGKIKRKILGIK